MADARRVKGHLVDARTVERDEPADAVTGEVEVILPGPAVVEPPAEGILADFLRGLPAGSRTKADIDGQLRLEREAWGD